MYVRSDSKLVALDSSTGEPVTNVVSASVSEPAVTDETMYVFSSGCLKAVDTANATHDWTVDAEEHVSDQPVVAGDALYYSTWKVDGEKVARDTIVVRDVENGTLLAEHDVSDVAEFSYSGKSPLVPVGGTVYALVGGSLVAFRGTLGDSKSRDKC